MSIFAGTGCGETKARPVDFSEVTRNYASEDYGRVLKNWTRHGKLVTDSGTVLEAWATLKSWEFRQAYIEHYGAIYGLADAERTELRQSQLEVSQQSFEFHVIAQSTSQSWNDLERRTSPWRIALVDGTGAELAPEATQLTKLPELYQMQFFPTRTAFGRTYVIRFPRKPAEGEPAFAGASSGQLILRIMGPLGKLDLVWQSQ
jgi:hypothetical protein